MFSRDGRDERPVPDPSVPMPEPDTVSEGYGTVQKRDTEKSTRRIEVGLGVGDWMALCFLVIIVFVLIDGCTSMVCETVLKVVGAGGG